MKIKNSTKEVILDSIELSVSIGAEILVAIPIAALYIKHKKSNFLVKGLAFLGATGISLAIGNAAGKAVREVVESLFIPAQAEEE